MTIKDKHMQWKKTGEAEFKGAYKTYLTRTFVSPKGVSADFDVTMLKHGGFSEVLALTSLFEVIAAKQFRPGPEMVTNDMPAGIFDEGEDAEQAIRRELLEETGYEPGMLIALNPGGNIQGPYDSALGHYFLALDCVRIQEQDLHDSEEIEVVTIPLRDYVNNVLRQGRATHADCGWLAIDYMLQNKMITLENIAA